MLSISSGHSAEYLTGAVGQGRENYYLSATTEGEPPGRWWGVGAAALGLAGEVDAAEMESIFTHFHDPRDARWADPATRSQSARLGSAPGQYATPQERLARLLEAEPDASPERVAELERAAERGARQAVAFHDLTFSPPKSVTVLHTAFARAELDAQRAGNGDLAHRYAHARRAVERAVWDGNNAMLECAQDAGGYARTGRHGAGAGRWEDAHTFTVASFFQHTSRANDPQLHVHNAVLNRVMTGDGQVRAIDGKALYACKQSAGSVGERVMRESMTAALGVGWTMRADGVTWEVTGVDKAAMDLFSSRSTKMTKTLATKVDHFRDTLGREPNALELDRLRRQSSLATRPAKSHNGTTRAQELERWDRQLRAEVAGGLHRIAEQFTAADAVEHGPVTISESAVIAKATAAAQAASPTFGRGELERQIDLALPATTGMDATDARELVSRLADEAVRSGALVQVTGEQTTASVPAPLRAADGRSVYAAPYAPRWSTRDHWVAEQALTRVAVERGGLAVEVADVERWLTNSKAGAALGADQAAAVRGLLTSGARMSVLVGPAGTGKSHTMGAMADGWRALTGGRVVGVATSQIATEVLAEMADDGVPALNVSRWLAAQRSGDDEWALKPSDVVVVDEASMVDTDAVSDIWARVHAAGARMILTGDPRQLGAIGAGGVMELLADGRADTYDLAEVRRFGAQWEAHASLRLREGDLDAIGEYDRRGRVLDAGTASTAAHSAARAWLGDHLAGHHALVVAPTNAQAAEVSALVRAELVALGKVSEQGALLERDGNTAGVGDVVQARRNDWSAGVVNRRLYDVAELRRDGSMRLAARDGSGDRVVKAGYVSRNLTLGYAATAHAAQGVTVDRCHAIVTAAMSRAAAYVALTRGRLSNVAHVVTRAEHADAPTGETHQREQRTATAILADVVDSDTAEQRAALAQRAADADAAHSMHAIGAQREDAVRLACRARTGEWLDRLATDGVISPEERAAFAADSGTHQLAAQLRAVEQSGADPERVLRTAVEGRPLTGARSVAQVTQHRITEAHGAFTPSGPLMSTPAGVGQEWADHLDTLADLADERRHTLGTELAADPPGWALEALGPVPDETLARVEWEDRAGRVAAYRELATPADDDGVIGAAPGLSSPERRAEWYQAWDALGRPEAGAEGHDLSEGALRCRVEAWRREQAWQPANVDAEMRATGQSVARHEQDASILEAKADHVSALGDDAGAEALRVEAADRRAVARLLTRTEADLAAAAEARTAWLVETAQTRLAAEQAQRALADRGVALGNEPDRVTAAQWLLAHRAEQAAEDAHRVVRDEADLADEREARAADERAASDLGRSVDTMQDHQETAAAPSQDQKARGFDPDYAGETDDHVAMPAGVPTRADAEATALQAETVAAELADRRSAEQAHERDDQAVREVAWREADHQAERAAEREDTLEY